MQTKTIISQSNPAPRYKVNIGFTATGKPRFRRFATLEEATALCSEVFQKSGIVLSITNA